MSRRSILSTLNTELKLHFECGFQLPDFGGRGPQRLPHHIQVARFTIDVSVAVAAPKVHSEYQKTI